jgi:general secretion pathway protein N
MKKGFIAICFLLGAACAGAVALATQPAPNDTVEPKAGSGAGQPAAAPPAAADSAVDKAGRWESAVLARPLFNPDRRPVGQATAAAGEDAGLPRLSGIMITPDGKSAIFAPAGGGKPAVVAEGGSLGGYVVRTISLDEVVLAGPDGSHSLTPTLDHVDPAGRSAPPVITGQGPASAAPPKETNP